MKIIVEQSDIDTQNPHSMQHCVGAKCLSRYIKPEYTVSVGFITAGIYAEGDEYSRYSIELPEDFTLNVVCRRYTNPKLGTYEVHIPQKFLR